MLGSMTASDCRYFSQTLGDCFNCPFFDCRDDERQQRPLEYQREQRAATAHALRKQGLSRKDITSRLHISSRTLERYLSNGFTSS